MIKLTISNEAVTDLLTPGICGPTELVEGLPRDVALSGVKFNNEMVEYSFDDGKDEVSVATIKYIKLMN